MRKLYGRLLFKLKSKTDFPPTHGYQTSDVCALFSLIVALAFFAWQAYLGMRPNPQGAFSHPANLVIAVCGFVILSALDHNRSRNLQVVALLATGPILGILLLLGHYSEMIMAGLRMLNEFLINQFVVLEFGLLVCAVMLSLLKLMKNPSLWLADKLVTDWMQEWKDNSLQAQGAAFTPFDKKSICVHEAGHAIVLGLNPLIDDTCRLVLSSSPEPGRYGYCSLPKWPHVSKMRHYLMMDMVVIVAGIEAERLVYGDCSTGGVGDYHMWLDRVEQFLRSHPDQVYFCKPSTPAQIEHNRMALNELRSQHQALARRILEANRDLLETLSDRLLEAGTIEGPELRFLLKEVVSVEGVPDYSDLRLQRVYQRQVA